MVIPMLLLGAAAVAAGYLANPQWGGIFGIPKHWITEFLIHGLESNLLVGVLSFETPEFNLLMALASTVIALAGVGVAYLLYGKGSGRSRDPLESAGPVHKLLTQKYYLDALYEGVAVRQIFYRAFAGTLDWMDRNLVDGTVGLLGWIFQNIGPKVMSPLQSGQVQTYGAVLALGLLAILMGFLLT